MVDGGSTDGTLQIALNHQALVAEIKGQRDTRTSAKNLGAGLSTGSILLFLDSDMELPPDLLKMCEARIAEGLEAVIISETSVGGRALSRMRNWEAAAKGDDPLTQFSRLLTKSAFKSVGGFDDLLSSYEDLDLQARLLRAGIRMGFLDFPILHHEENLSWPAFLKKQLRYALNATKYRARNPTESMSVHSVCRRLIQYVRGLREPDDTLPFFLALATRAAEVAALFIGALLADRVRSHERAS